MEKNDKTGIFPKISTKELRSSIEPQVGKIIKDVISKAIKKGNCCLPSKDGNHSSNIIYHPIGVDLLIDNNKKVWFIEANPGVGFSLIPKDIIDIYKQDSKNKLDGKNNLDGRNNFNAKLYNLVKLAGVKNRCYIQRSIAET